jgi:hypothetical protein
VRSCTISSPTPKARPKIGVTIPPGQMQFTRMPCSPSSVATVLVSWITAAFIAP